MRRKLYDVPASSKHEDVVRHRATRRVYPRPMVASRAHSPIPTPVRVLSPLSLLSLSLLSSACSSPSSPPPDAPPSSPPDARCLFSSPDAAPPSTSGCPELPATPDRLDEALALAGLDRCSLGYTPTDLAILPASILADADRLPFFDALWTRPLRAVPWARRLIAEIDAAFADGASPVSAAILAAAARLGHSPVACGAVAPPTGPTPLVDAVFALISSNGGLPDRVALEADAADVPPALQLALARVIAGVADAATARDVAIQSLDSLHRVVAFATPGWISPLGGPPRDDRYLAALRGEAVDLPALYGAAASLALVVEESGLAAQAGASGFSFRAETPLGLILIGDAADDTWDAVRAPGPIALLVDTGGDDHYLVPVAATAGPEHGVALAIDLDGADRYGYVEVPDADDGARLPSDDYGRASAGPYGPFTRSGVPRQGSGILGIGLLTDLGGDSDHYRSLAYSQGFGALGVGVLFDDGGDDRYEVEIGGQGAGVFGIGLLLDGGGADEHRIYTMGQGFGYVRGVGLLADAGDARDIYFAEPDDSVYYSPQLPGNGNSSFVQGAGFGRRDEAGGHMSGGLGLLTDAGGDDSYTASVFGQGTGYWFGTGILADAAGNDTVDGKWYVQGSAAHFALALHLDDGGDDVYNGVVTPAATSIGVGHDLSIGIHLDGGGNDRYRAPGLSLGAGNVNGVGLLINLGGDDEYHAAGEPSLPAGNHSGEIPPGTVREQRPTVGLFIDVGGADRYDVPGSTVVRADGASWTNNRRTPAVPTEHSAGLDAPDGTVVLP